MAILIKDSDFDPKVFDMIYDKQRDLRKEKGFVVSLAKTVERLLKDAYPKEIEAASKRQS